MNPHLDVFTLNTDTIRGRIRTRVNRLMQTLTDEPTAVIPQNDAEIPPIELVMCIPTLQRKEHFYASVQIGDELLARVAPMNEYLNAICFVNKRRFIDDLDIRLFCTKVNGVSGDILKVCVMHIIRDQRKVIVEERGVYSSDDDPIPKRNNSDYHTCLESSLSYNNPTCVQQLCSEMRLPQFASLLLEEKFEETAKTLRRKQSSRWAHSHVVKGIKALKSCDYLQAQQSLNSALQIDPNNVEAIVARGALFHNNESYTHALEEFNKALQLQPNHENAQKYLSETLLAIGKKQHQRGELELASKTLTRAKHVNEHLSETKTKLRLLLDEEKKRKKKKKRRDSSSSSSSSSSSPSSTSSSDEKSKKRKKRKKYEFKPPTVEWIESKPLSFQMKKLPPPVVPSEHFMSDSKDVKPNLEIRNNSIPGLRSLKSPEHRRRTSAEATFRNQRERSRSRSPPFQRYCSNSAKMNRARNVRERIERQLARDKEMEEKIAAMAKPF